MKMFTIGPVQMDKRVIKANDKGIEYFRNQEFSNKMFEIERLMLNLLHAPKEYKSIILTCSGTGGMDAVVSGLPLDKKMLIINGGTFGQRFVELCQFYNIPYDELKVEYNKEVLNKFCEEEDCYLIIDAISSMFADEYDLSKFKADVTIFSSHKGLALAPGICMVILSGKYINNVIDKYPSKSYYLDIRSHLKNMERGQTPFTPGLAEIQQLYVRLKQLKSYENEIERIKNNAMFFRRCIKDLGYEYPSFSLSNCITPIICPNGDADKILEYLKSKDIYVNPCGGENAKKVLRISHVGDLNISDFKKLIKTMRSYKWRLF